MFLSVVTAGQPGGLGFRDSWLTGPNALYRQFMGSCPQWFILGFRLSWPYLDALPSTLFLQGQELLSLENELKISQQVL